MDCNGGHYLEILDYAEPWAVLLIDIDFLGFINNAFQSNG